MSKTLKFFILIPKGDIMMREDKPESIGIAEPPPMPGPDDLDRPDDIPGKYRRRRQFN